jgi:hypothetical protein
MCETKIRFESNRQITAQQDGRLLVDASNILIPAWLAALCLASAAPFLPILYPV